MRKGCCKYASPRARMHRTDFEREIRMQAIILCGGLATRLGNATKTVPKVLLDIAGKTVLEWQIQLLKDANVQAVTLASGHLHNVLYEHVGQHYAGVKIRYAKEEKRTRHWWRDSECDAMYHHISFFRPQWAIYSLPISRCSGC